MMWAEIHVGVSFFFVTTGNEHMYICKRRCVVHPVGATTVAKVNLHSFQNAVN